mmetsp:Transcript_33349/g.53787  ORF Transcript_33349/g.53787 Transcript_33349/m.53787 type:complete len:238 (+) Transcript_33349:1-714(+)
MASADPKKMSRRFQKYLKHIELTGNVKRIVEEILFRLKENPQFDIWSYFSLRLYEVGVARDQKKKRNKSPSASEKESKLTTKDDAEGPHDGPRENNEMDEMKAAKSKHDIFLSKWELLSTAWKVLDINGDGYISRKEFEDGLDRSGLECLDKKTRDELWEEADINRDNKIGYKELKAVFNRWMQAKKLKKNHRKKQSSVRGSRERVKQRREEEAEKLRKIKKALATGHSVQDGVIVE